MEIWAIKQKFPTFQILKFSYRGRKMSIQGGKFLNWQTVLISARAADVIVFSTLAMTFPRYCHLLYICTV